MYSLSSNCSLYSLVNFHDKGENFPALVTLLLCICFSSRPFDVLADENFDSLKDGVDATIQDFLRTTILRAQMHVTMGSNLC